MLFHYRIKYQPNIFPYLCDSMYVMVNDMTSFTLNLWYIHNYVDGILKEILLKIVAESKGDHLNSLYST